NRLAAAAQAMREREVTSQRKAELSGRQRDLRTEAAALRAKAEDESKDVERLEGMSLGRVLASLAGSRDERLARWRAGGEAARYKLTEGETRLAAVNDELSAVEQRLATLESAPHAYAAVLDEKERYLTGSGDAGSRALLTLADERGRLTADLNETDE